MAALPIIDPTPYLPSSSAPVEEERRKVSKQLHEACRDVGFFYLRIADFLTADELRDILQVGREFFALEQEEKNLVGLDKSDGVRGYQRLHQNVTQGKSDHHEGYDIYAPNPYPSSSSSSSSIAKNGATLRPLEGSNPFPENPERFRKTIEEWIEKMKVLGMAVMRGMADGLDMNESEWQDLRGKVDDSFWVMRVIGYPPLPDGADGISCGEHKDYGCLTFLHADPIPGSLQVLSRQNEWLAADPIPGCIVVNIGAMWEIWTGGLYPATSHRVIHRSPTYRISVPFFFEPNFDARVSLLDAARRKAEHEGRVVIVEKEVIYGEYLLNKVGGNFKY